MVVVVVLVVVVVGVTVVVVVAGTVVDSVVDEVVLDAPLEPLVRVVSVMVLVDSTVSVVPQAVSRTAVRPTAQALRRVAFIIFSSYYGWVTPSWERKPAHKIGLIRQLL